MHYFYADEAGQPAGPVELAALYAAVQARTLSPDTPVVESGGAEWTPLSQVLTYQFAVAGEIHGPVRLASLPALAATHGRELPVIPVGGREWVPVFTVLNIPPRQFVMVPVTIPRHSPEGAPHVRGLYLPDSAKAAGVLWFLFGLLKIIDGFVVIGNLSSVPVAARDAVLVILGISVLAAALFLRAGLQTCSGSAKGTRGNGIGSLALGLLVLMGAAGTWRMHGSVELALILASAATLILAGVLAIVAHNRYTAWRNAPRRR